ncbi:MAG: hypothetical protein WCC90_03990 [Methylocella sp.]
MTKSAGKRWTVTFWPLFMEIPALRRLAAICEVTTRSSSSQPQSRACQSRRTTLPKDFMPSVCVCVAKQVEHEPRGHGVLKAEAAAAGVTDGRSAD